MSYLRGGFLSEIDRMNLEVAEYLSVHSSKLIKPDSLIQPVHLSCYHYLQEIGIVEASIA